MLSTLPELILDVLCEHLSYEDILMLRCTCKSLKTFVDLKKFTILHLFVRKFPFHRKLFYTGETVGYSNSCHSGNFSILESSRLISKQFLNVQKMTIYYRHIYGDFGYRHYSLDLDLNEFNCFRELTHLEIYSKYCNITGKLNLPKLQISALEVDSLFSQNSFELDCSRLRALKIRYNCKVTLTSATDQLEYLHYDLDKDYLNSICSNLKKLSTIVFRNPDFLLKFLSDLKARTIRAPSLSEIRLEDRGSLRPLDELARILEGLKNHREGIRFTMMGRPINLPDELLRISELRRVFQVENFESHLSWVSETLKSNQIDINRISDEELDSYMHGNDLEIRNLKDRSLLFLNKHPELQFLLASARTVCLNEDIELNEEIIKRLKNITFLGFNGLFRPSDLITELVIGNCKSLRSYHMYHQMVTERLLEMMSEQLLNLEELSFCSCKHETLKPLAKFRNLVSLTVDFDPQKDELQFIFENSRSLEAVRHRKRFELLRTLGMPKMHKLTIFGGSRDSSQYFEFDTLGEMMEKYANLDCSLSGSN